MTSHGKVIVITGPSGVGKGTLIGFLLDEVPDLEFSTSATTRPPRGDEVDGRDYYFLDTSEFQRRVDAGEFIEHASYGGNLYGTLRSEVERRLIAGKSVVLEIELEGARQIRAAMPDAVLVFIAPPDEASLRQRLEGRGTDSPEAIESRLATAVTEMAARGEFAHEVVNDDLQTASIELIDVVRRALALNSPE